MVATLVSGYWCYYLAFFSNILQFGNFSLDWSNRANVFISVNLDVSFWL